jgi:DNA-directed RNA polymerase specialized sigma24 family protein
MGLPVPKQNSRYGKYLPEVREAIVAARLGGMPYLRIARAFRVPYATVHRICKEAGA